MAADLRSLFLGDLSVYCTEKDVKDFFQPFGPIEAIKLKRGSDRNHLSYGFICFVHPESAHAALERLQGVVFLGRPIKLGWAQRNIGKKYQPRDPTENFKTAQIHVSFISKQVDALVSEATLRSLFGMYGQVEDVTIKKSQFDQKLRIQNGYGFVHYRMNVVGIQAAIQATRNIHQVTVDRVTYDCSLSHSLEQIVQGDPMLLQLWSSPRETHHGSSLPAPFVPPTPVIQYSPETGKRFVPRPPAAQVHSLEKSLLTSFDGSFAAYNSQGDFTVPSVPSREGSISSAAELESSRRDPSIVAHSRAHRRPSESFSEISNDPLEAFGNLNLSSNKVPSRLLTSDLSGTFSNSHVPIAELGGFETSQTSEQASHVFLPFDFAKRYF